MPTKRHRVGGKKTRARIATNTPEGVLLDWWVEARRKRDTTKNPTTRRKYYALADRLQYALQDLSPLGHRMVWGSEYAAERDDRNAKTDLELTRKTKFGGRS
jgi:hypothetical protein